MTTATRNLPLFEPTKLGRQGSKPLAHWYKEKPVSVEGWLQMIFRKERDNVRLDALADALEAMHGCHTVEDYYAAIKRIHNGDPDAYNAVLDEILRFMEKSWNAKTLATC